MIWYNKKCDKGNEEGSYGHGKTVTDLATVKGKVWHQMEKFKLDDVIGLDL